GHFSAQVVGGTLLSRFGPQARLYHAAKLQPLTLYRGKNAAPTFVTAEIPIVGGAFFSTGCRRDIFVPIRVAGPLIPCCDIAASDALSRQKCLSYICYGRNANCRRGIFQHRS